MSGKKKRTASKNCYLNDSAIKKGPLSVDGNMSSAWLGDGRLSEPPRGKTNKRLNGTPLECRAEADLAMERASGGVLRQRRIYMFKVQTRERGRHILNASRTHSRQPCDVFEGRGTHVTYVCSGRGHLQSCRATVLFLVSFFLGPSREDKGRPKKDE